MVVRSIFFILLFAVLLCHSATAQDTTEESTGETTSNDTSPSNTTTPVPTTTTTILLTTPSTSCKYPDEFPLFGDDTCISRAAYTAIFLISIILAGISFLMLIGLLILYCTRHSKSPEPGDTDSYKSNDSHTGDNKSVSRNSTMTRSREVYANPARHEEPMRSTNAPYAPAKSVPKVATRPVPTSVKQQRSDSIEMDYRPTNKPPSNPSRTKPSSTPKITNLDDVRERSHTRVTPPIEDTETSYF